ncbi:MAG: hypothetical protein ACREBO_08560 [Novosphingobium sp.]
MSYFPTRMFRGAAIYGVIVLAPLYLAPLPQVGAETVLGFIGITLAFQAVFWIIGGNPRKYRALMLPAIAEKLAFGVPALALWVQGRTPGMLAAFGAIDLLLALGFAVALRRTPRQS